MPQVTEVMFEHLIRLKEVMRKQLDISEVSSSGLTVCYRVQHCK